MDPTPLHPLIDVDELAGLVAREDPVVVLDVRWALGSGVQREAFAAGHVPGSRLVDLDADLSGAPGEGGRHPLPATPDFLAAMRRLGVRRDARVVVLDAADGTSAARAWWLLRHHGHGAVQVLDGGFAAWAAGGAPIETGAGDPVAPGDLDGEPGSMPVVDADAAAVLAREGTLVDARAAVRYRGESEPVDPVAGHVPGAVDVPTTDHVGPEGRWDDAATLARRFEDAGVDPARPVGAYCGSGVTACHTVLALEVAGRSAALYPGSWSAWVRDPSRPVATGPEPG
ncbi:MAG: sulfurtransferase [Nocardioidaceae bacterium]|nr:sulfurtransferase [Nocardioidaceae bacterium]